MEVSEIYVHDAQLHRVIEDIDANLVVMQVGLPILERDEEFEPRFLVFGNAYNYRVFEQPWHGVVTILSMRVIGRHDRWEQIRIETNAGYREVFCADVRVCEENPIK